MQNSPVRLNSLSHPLFNIKKNEEEKSIQGIEEIKDEAAFSENESVSSQVNINPPFGSMGNLDDPQLFKYRSKADNNNNGRT